MRNDVEHVSAEEIRLTLLLCALQSAPTQRSIRVAAKDSIRACPITVSRRIIAAFKCRQLQCLYSLAIRGPAAMFRQACLSIPSAFNF